MFLKQFYRNRKVSQKIFINYIMLIVITVATLSAIVITVSSNALEKSADSNTLQVVKQVSGSIDERMLKYEDIIYYIATDEEIMSFVIGKENHREALDRLKIYENRNPGIVGIMVVSEDDRELSNTMRRISRDYLSQDLWFQNAINEPEHLQLISSPMGRNVAAYNTRIASDDVISLSKAIVDETGTVLGVILMDIDFGVFESIIEDTVVGEGGFVFIQDEKNQIVYTRINKVVYHIRPEIFDGSDVTKTVNIKGEDYKVSYIESDYTYWKTVGVFALSEALGSVNQLQVIILMMSIVIIALSFMASFFLSNSITKPIAKLKSLMKKAEEGELDLEYDSIYNDEVGQLGHSFNTMIASMKSLINLVYEEQKKKREAELEIFRAQIKPHFLYNTLDTIHWLVKENKNEESILVIKALTRLFRITLSKGKEIITVAEEIRHVESYLTIQSVRYEDKFDYVIECDEQIAQLRITKLILQPIVENAIYHGIKEKRGKGYICANFYVDDNVIKIVIEDDGVGLAVDDVKRINGVLRGHVQQTTEYGIYNVNEKIQLAYGEQYGVFVESFLGKGTKITILHPII